MKENDIKIILTNFISQVMGPEDIDLFPLPAAGSDRRYFRFSFEGQTLIATYVPDSAEGECFVKLARDFYDAGRNVPKILYVSEDCCCYIQEDLGDKSLFSMLASPEAVPYIKDTLRHLAYLQKSPREVWHADCMAKDFCKRQVLWDLNYFKYEFLKPQNVIFEEDRLEDDFERLSESLSSVSHQYYGFMMRDCQSRNVMITERGPVFIDFQGGRWGPALYDAVSFLWQARAAFNKEFKAEMLDFYCDCFCDGNEKMKTEMLEALDEIVILRTLQVLGAYGFRGLVQHRSHFLMSIPAALGNLRDLLEKGAIDKYPELKKCGEMLISNPSLDKREDFEGLTVEIFSFSYKKGYPADLSGNGGGFMFDCRSMHNPGRYAKYRSMTGRDKEVIQFLEQRGEVKAFLHHVWCLTDPAVERYLHRGFTNIQIGFGCTGGQHRSVYCAERTAAHVRKLFPEANIKLHHREHPTS